MSSYQNNWSCDVFQLHRKVVEFDSSRQNAVTPERLEAAAPRSRINHWATALLPTTSKEDDFFRCISLVASTKVLVRLRGGTGFLSVRWSHIRDLNSVRFVRLFLVGRWLSIRLHLYINFLSKQTRFFNIITYAQIPLFNNIANVFNGSRSLHLSLRLHQHPHSILWSFEHRMRRRVCAFVQTRRSLHCSMM